MPKDTTNNRTKPSSDGKLRDSELIGWLIGFLLFAIIAGSVFQALQSTFGDFGKDRMGIGAVVTARSDIDVYEEPTPGTILGTQEGGAQGEVQDGPIENEQITWWFVDFLESPDGWVEENGLRVLEGALGIGDIIEMIRTAGVWEQAGGGIGRGLQAVGAVGEIIGGPENFRGERWWSIDFDSSNDGWVREADFVRVEGGVARLWQRFMGYVLLPSIILSVLLIASVAVLLFRIRGLTTLLKERYQAPDTFDFIQSREERQQKNERWERVQQLVSSTEPANWRLAILEADIMLSDIVAKMGYVGDSLGERLKQVEKSDFVTLDKAWEAHKVRNTIAHEGGDFILTQREARRIISLFEEVFREFHYI